jgi:hypothetical protein
MTRAQQILNLGIGLRSPKCLCYVEQCDLRCGQPRFARKKSDDYFGDERFYSLPRATKLRDEHPTLICIDDGRERAALSEWLDITGCRVDRE